MADPHFYLHTSNRAENLAARLVEVVSEIPLSRPLSQETVMTLNPGIARWLQFEIARLTGVSFGWDFPLPGKLFSRILRGFEPSFDRTGVFPESFARWHLHDILGKLEAQPRFDQVRAYCDAAGGARRLSFAQRLTQLFDEYLVYRPDVIIDWEDKPDDSAFDWQAEIWRRLKRQLYPESQQSRHIARIWYDLRRGQILELSLAPQNWPERLFVFGVSSLAPLYLDFLEELARYRPVHVFLLQPSDMYWADLRTRKQIQKIAKKAAAKNKSGPALNSPEDWLFETGNPLLPALGKQSQMFLDLLIDKNPLQDDAGFEAPEPEYSQLACLQSDLFAIENRDLAKGGEAYPPYDGTLQVHVCSSRRREVETVWDLIVARFDAASDLKPNDILVMAPDIQAYRSHIEAVFESKRGTELEMPYSIADNAAGSRPGVLSGLLAVFESVSGRATSAEILSLCETPLLREAFSFSDQDLERIEFWIRELGITWGWNASHRDLHDCFATDRNTWREFRRRILSGFAFSHEAEVPGGFLAYPELEGDFCDTAARTVECLDLLFELRRNYEKAHPLDFWQQQLLALLSKLTTDKIEWEGQYLKAIELIREAVPSIDKLEATGAEVYRTICEKLNNTASGGGYLSGGVTFCSLKPMRSIPANTVILMGMNRLDFPRAANRLSFDLLARESRIGDRNTREEGRQFFLETLLSVRSHLFVTYQGFASNSDEKSEPSVVVEELLHYLENAMPEDAFKQLRFEHKRQSFDSIYFEDERFRTFDPERAGLHNRFSGALPHSAEKQTASIETPSAERVEAVDLETLIRFFAHPAKCFATNVAKIRIAQDEEALAEADALDNDGLARYQIRETFAQTLARGQPLNTVSQTTFSQKKLLPIGKIETPYFLSEYENALTVSEQLGTFDSVMCYGSLQIGVVTLSGEVLIRESDGRQIIVHTGELNAKRVFESWIRHLFATACFPAFKGETWLFSFHEKSKPMFFEKVSGAKELLTALVGFFLEGHTLPLPFFAEVSQSTAATYRKSKAASDEEKESEALEFARGKIESAQQPSEFYRTFEWDAFLQICFGDSYRPDNEFLRIAREAWDPCEAHSSKLTIDPDVGATK